MHGPMKVKFCNFMSHRNVDDGTRLLLLHQMPTSLRTGAYNDSLTFLLTFQLLFIKPQYTYRRKQVCVKNAGNTREILS